jgi:hypothetical protein
VGGDLGELRFLLGREMYFHAFKGTRKPSMRQRVLRGCPGRAGETDPQSTDPCDQDERENHKSNSDFTQWKAPECSATEQDRRNENASPLLNGH